MEEKIIGFFAQGYRRDPATLSRDTNIKTDLGGSSLQLVTVIANTEDEFDITYPMADASKCETIGEFIDEVAARMD